MRKVIRIASLITYCLTLCFASGTQGEVRIAERYSNYLVVGSFAEESRAMAELERISEATGSEGLLLPVTVDQKTYNRILIGPLSEEDENRYRRLARDTGVKDAWILRGLPDEATGRFDLSSSETPSPGLINTPIIEDDEPITSTPAVSTFSGYVKSFAVAVDEVNTDFFNLKTTYQSQNSIRLMWERFADNTVWQMHYELSPVFVSRSQRVESQTFNVVGESYRLTDIQTSLSDEDSKNQLYQNLDRLNVQWQFDHGDLTIGRQAISFGSARFINPTDIFLPFNVQTLNQEYRTGVDAIRYQSPMGELGEFDVGIVFGKDAKPEKSAAFLQLRGNVNGKDLQFALTRFSEQTLVGAGIQTALGDFGFWFEAANVTGDFDYLRSSIGLDYAFTENTFAMVEYHYNGAGSDNPEDYLSLLDTLPYRQGGVFLLGKEYIMPSISLQASPLWSIAFQGIYNLSDDSAFLSVSAEYNVAEDFYMDFGYYHFIGDELTVEPPGIPVLQSEYGTNPDTVFASLRFYF